MVGQLIPFTNVWSFVFPTVQFYIIFENTDIRLKQPNTFCFIKYSAVKLNSTPTHSVENH